MSYSPNDKVYEANWNEIDVLSDKQKKQALLNAGILTEDDVEDGLFTSKELTDWCHEAGLIAERIEQL